MTNPTTTSTFLSDSPKESMLGDFFHEELKNLYGSELCVAKLLPDLKMASYCGELVAAFESHYDQTLRHLARLEEVFQMLGYPPQAKNCEAMQGLVKEAERVVAETVDGTATRDTGLIMAAQKIEHYEIAAYGCLHKIADSAGFEAVAALLLDVLAEKKETDKILTFIAENHINYEPVIEE